MLGPPLWGTAAGAALGVLMVPDRPLLSSVLGAVLGLCVAVAAAEPPDDGRRR